MGPLPTSCHTCSQQSWPAPPLPSSKPPGPRPVSPPHTTTPPAGHTPAPAPAAPAPAVTAAAGHGSAQAAAAPAVASLRAGSVAAHGAALFAAGAARARVCPMQPSTCHCSLAVA